MSSEDSEYISVESAGKLLGVTPRTIRNWINDGKLPAIEGKRGRLIRRSDAVFLGNISGHQAETTETETLSGSASVRSSAEVPETSAISVSAYSQLEAIREEWLAPLVAQIAEQAEMIGGLKERTQSQAETISRLTGELDQQHSEVEAVQELLAGSNAERDALRSRVSGLEQRGEESPQPREMAVQERPQRAQKPRQRKWWLRLFGIDE